MAANHSYRHYVIAVDPDDEYDDSITHAAVELRPSFILRLLWKSLFAQIIEQLALSIGVNVHPDISAYGEITWLDFNPVDDDFPEEWEEGAVENTIAQSLYADTRTWNDHIRLGSTLCFCCSGKHSGTDFTSHEAVLDDLVAAIRWTDITAELGEWWNKIRKQHPAAEPI
jgi:hypothetical protein